MFPSGLERLKVCANNLLEERTRVEPQRTADDQPLERWNKFGMCFLRSVGHSTECCGFDDARTNFFARVFHHLSPETVDKLNATAVELAAKKNFITVSVETNGC